MEEARENEDSAHLLKKGTLKDDIQSMLKHFADGAEFDLAKGLLAELGDHPDLPDMSDLMRIFEVVKEKVTTFQSEVGRAKRAKVAEIRENFDEKYKVFEVKWPILTKKLTTLKRISATENKATRQDYLAVRNQKMKVISIFPNI